MTFWKHLLWPVAFLWAVGAWIRNWLYDSGFLSSAEFEVPVISIGNLSMGGSGKTPHTEYFLYRFRNTHRIAVLSRGYRRRTSGFRIAGPSDTYEQVGDEPRQIKAKFRDITVAVGENRALAIPSLFQAAPHTDMILLDDAYQHRSVKPALSLLLTPFKLPFWKDDLFPVGWLREPKHNSKRADILIVTKCPPDFTAEVEGDLRKQCPLLPHQRLFFSAFHYGIPYRFLYSAERAGITADTTVLMFTGIADGSYLKDHLQTLAKEVIWIEFDDHYNYEQEDLLTLQEAFSNLDVQEKMIITTEKDAVRLEPYKEWIREEDLAIYCMPVVVEFVGSNKHEFDKLVLEYLNFFHSGE